MSSPPSDRVHDPERLAALRRSGLLGTLPEESFDRLTRMAARLLDAPVALVSLVDSDRQFFKSCLGLPEPWASERQTPLSHSFCQHVVHTEEPLVIEDARDHPLVRENLAIRDLGVIAYAGIPLRTSDGHVLGSLCAIDSHPRKWTPEEVRTLRDLAASVVTEIELRLAVERAEAASRAKSEFLATMSHEIRTPINAVLGYAELMEEGIGGALDEVHGRYVRRIRGSGRHLLTLVEDILDLAKVEAGEMSVARERVLLTPVVEEALGIVEPLLESRGLALSDETDCYPEVEFWGDRNRVRQILVNLLSNAAKFTEAGWVRLRCRVHAEAAELRTTHPGPWLAVEVEDTGVGIREDAQETVFEPFVQVDGSYTRTRRGTGLGLAISRTLARLMAGGLTLRSTPGEGSCFTLWLPAAVEGEEPPDRRSQADRRRRGDRRSEGDRRARGATP